MSENVKFECGNNAETKVTFTVEETDRSDREGRVAYRWSCNVDEPGVNEHARSDYDLHGSAAGGETEREMLGTLLKFVSAAMESREYRERSRRVYDADDDTNESLFPAEMLERLAGLGLSSDEVASVGGDVDIDARLPPLDEMVDLVENVRDSIEDNDQADEESEGPCVELTVGCDSRRRWGYQTGDNSFTGGAYGYPHWAVVTVYRDSDPNEVANEIREQIGEILAERGI